MLSLENLESLFFARLCIFCIKFGLWQQNEACKIIFYYTQLYFSPSILCQAQEDRAVYRG